MSVSDFEMKLVRHLKFYIEQGPNLDSANTIRWEGACKDWSEILVHNKASYWRTMYCKYEHKMYFYLYFIKVLRMMPVHQTLANAAMYGTH